MEMYNIYRRIRLNWVVVVIVTAIVMFIWGVSTEKDNLITDCAGKGHTALRVGPLRATITCKIEELKP